MNDEPEIDDWPVPSAEVRLELDRRPNAWADPDMPRNVVAGHVGND